MQLGITTKALSFENQAWLYSHDGAKGAKPATLLLSLFTEGTHFPNGYFPSGLELGRVTATGKFGPFNPGANDGRELRVFYLFTSLVVRYKTGEAVGAVLDGTFTPTIVKSKLPIATQLNGTTELTLGRRFIYEA